MPNLHFDMKLNLIAPTKKSGVYRIQVAETNGPGFVKEIVAATSGQTAPNGAPIVGHGREDANIAMNTLLHTIARELQSIGSPNETFPEQPDVHPYKSPGRILTFEANLTQKAYEALKTKKNIGFSADISL